MSHIEGSLKDWVAIAKELMKITKSLIVISISNVNTEPTGTMILILGWNQEFYFTD